MYVAQRKLPIKKADGTSGFLSPGEEVVGFETWPLWQRRIHLENEFIVNTQGPLLADRLVQPTAPATRPSLSSKPAVEQEEQLQSAIQTQGAVQADDQIETEGEEDDQLVCPQCQKGPFKSEHGLRLHVGKAHA